MQSDEIPFRSYNHIPIIEKSGVYARLRNVIIGSLLTRPSVMNLKKKKKKGGGERLREKQRRE